MQESPDGEDDLRRERRDIEEELNPRALSRDEELAAGTGGGYEASESGNEMQYPTLVNSLTEMDSRHKEIVGLERFTQPLPTVVIADDDPDVIGEIGYALQLHFDIVATVSNGRSLVEVVRGCSPALVVVDISMPQMNGLQATRAITTEFPEVKVLVLSVHAEPEYIDAAFEAGASGYVVKTGQSLELVTAIDRVLAGESYQPQV